MTKQACVLTVSLFKHPTNLAVVDAEEFARLLASKERRQWQNPEAISEAIGIERGMTVADLACGPGFFTIPIARRVGSGGRVYAVDANPIMLKHLRANVRKAGAPRSVIRIIRADVSSTGIPAKSVDASIFVNVLHDIDDKRAFLREVSRISKPGASIVDIDWAKARTGLGPPIEIRLGLSESMKILERNGFGVVRSIDAGRHHYGLVCRRAL